MRNQWLSAITCVILIGLMAAEIWEAHQRVEFLSRAEKAQSKIERLVVSKSLHR